MSTPSTATVTYPSHYQHHPPPHYGYYLPPPPPTASASTTPADAARLANSYAYAIHNPPSPPPPPPPPATAAATAAAMSSPATMSNPSASTSVPTVAISSAGKKKQPDWGEFYKNGLPKEVIVIDDSPAPESSQTAATNSHNRSHQQHQQQHHHHHHHHQPAGKKRKTGLQSNHDLLSYDRPSYSINPHHYGDASSAGSLSTDRTTSLHTTAPTSMGSQGSSGTSNGIYYHHHHHHHHHPQDVNIGQKRKRTTRKSARDEQKQRDLETYGDAYLSYVPPPNPPIKAKDVQVPVVRAYGPRDKYDDEDGHYVVTPDAPLTDRYSIIKLLGQGTFGKVVEAYDKQQQNLCAVKIIRSVQKYRDASRIELRVLSTLSSNDRANRNKCIHLRDCFDYRNHICIVTDLLGQSVFDFLKGNGFVPFPASHIQNFARQLFTSVAFLHDLNLIHTDLKPENILLVSNAYQTFTYNRAIPSSSHTVSRNARHRRVLLNSDIRLIDFGSATFDDEYHSSVVSTRHYRAPEIILNLGWSYPCDIWSIGCILVEFFTGDALFQTHDNLEHLAMMETVTGNRIEPKIVRQVVNGSGRGSSQNQAARYFNRSKLYYPNEETSRSSRKYVKAMKHLDEFIPTYTTFHRQFLDLLRRIFVYDPKNRITAKEALKHPWFRETLVDDGTEAFRIGKELMHGQQV